MSSRWIAFALAAGLAPAGCSSSPGGPPAAEPAGRRPSAPGPDAERSFQAIKAGVGNPLKAPKRAD